MAGCVLDSKQPTVFLTLSPTDERRNLFFLEPTREYQSGDGEVKTIVQPAAGPSRPWRQMVESTPWTRYRGILHLERSRTPIV